MLIVDGVCDATGALDMVQDARPDVFRHTEAGEVGADSAAQVVHSSVGDSEIKLPLQPARLAASNDLHQAQLPNMKGAALLGEIVVLIISPADALA